MNNITIGDEGSLSLNLGSALIEKTIKDTKKKFKNAVNCVVTTIVIIAILFVISYFGHHDSKTAPTSSPDETHGDMTLGDFGFEKSKSKKFVDAKYSSYPTYERLNLTSYNLHLDIGSLEDEWVSAESCLSFEVEDYNTHYNFDLSEQTIKMNNVEVSINGRTIESSFDFYNTDKLTVEFKGEKIKRKAPNSLKIQIKFSFKIQVFDKLAKGLYRVKTPDNGFVLQTNLSNGNVKYVFPSFDLYRTNFSFTFSTSTPNKYSTFSNGVVATKVKSSDKILTTFTEVYETRFSNYGWVIGKLDYYYNLSAYENLAISSRNPINKEKVEHLFVGFDQVSNLFEMSDVCQKLDIVFVPVLEDHQDIARCIITLDEKYLELDNHPVYSYKKVKPKKQYTKALLKQLFGGKLTPLNEQEEWVLEALREVVERRYFSTHSESLFERNPFQHALEASGHLNAQKLGYVDESEANNNNEEYKEAELSDDFIIRNPKERLNKGIFLFNMIASLESPRKFITCIQYIIKNAPTHFAYRDFHRLYLKYKEENSTNKHIKNLIEDIVYKAGIPIIKVRVDSLNDEHFSFHLEQSSYILTENNLLYITYNTADNEDNTLNVRKEVNIIVDDNGNKVTPSPETYTAPLTLDGLTNNFITTRKILFMNNHFNLAVNVEMNKESTEKDKKSYKNYLGYNLTNNYFVLTDFYEIPGMNLEYLYRTKYSAFSKNYLFKMRVWLRGNLLSLKNALKLKKDLYIGYKNKGSEVKYAYSDNSLVGLVDFGVYLNKLIISSLQRKLSNCNKEDKQSLKEKLEKYKTKFILELLDYQKKLSDYKSHLYSLDMIPDNYTEYISFLVEQALISLGSNQTLNKYYKKFNDEDYKERDAAFVYRSAVKKAATSSVDEQFKLHDKLLDILKRNDVSLTVKREVLKALGKFENKAVIDSVIDFAMNQDNNLYGKYRVLILEEIVNNGIFTEFALNQLFDDWEGNMEILEDTVSKRGFLNLFGFSGSKEMISKLKNIVDTSMPFLYDVISIMENIGVNRENDKYNYDI